MHNQPRLTAFDFTVSSGPENMGGMSPAPAQPTPALPPPVLPLELTPSPSPAPTSESPAAALYTSPTPPPASTPTTYPMHMPVDLDSANEGEDSHEESGRDIEGGDIQADDEEMVIDTVLGARPKALGEWLQAMTLPSNGMRARAPTSHVEFTPWHATINYMSNSLLKTWGATGVTQYSAMNECRTPHATGYQNCQLERALTEEFLPCLELNKKSVSEWTVQQWLVKLGWHRTRLKKGVYMDGHERSNVVKYRNETFLFLMAKYERCMVKWTENANGSFE
ncbi:hypothetical protein EDB92DRAFT_1815763 [Lactarius akahatsu]|uniref:Uncharacterized protein n=1 Tax=Lactarius akahatsu TaxID=416441 RepID=A0AAD4LH58_9AGAM|nr:hypothetical protein EDB92DRAFT_1815763 [Lactarius akahatsu]